jgi:hypothetical protein
MIDSQPSRSETYDLLQRLICEVRRQIDVHRRSRSGQLRTEPFDEWNTIAVGGPVVVPELMGANYLAQMDSLARRLESLNPHISQLSCSYI